MNFRVTAVLFGVVFVVAVVLLVLSFREEDKAGGGDVLAQELVAAGAKPADVDSIEFERADGSTLVIVRTDKDKNTWQIQKPITARAEASRVVPIIAALLKAKPTPYAELTSNPAAHGLEPPAVKVTIRQGTERSSTINLGDVTFGDKGVVFVTTSAQSKRPMAVRRSELGELFRDDVKDARGTAELVKWTSDFRALNVFPADSRAMGEDVTFLKLELPNKKKELTLTRPQPQDRWKFVSPAGWGEADVEGDSAAPPGTYTGVRRLLSDLANVSAHAPADFIDQPKDLKEYGLNPDNPDRVRVEMRTRDGQSVVAYFGKVEAGKEAPPPPLPGMPPSPPSGGKVYVQVEGQPGVIRAGGNVGGLVAVIADPGPLRDRDLLRVERPKQVDGIDIVLAGQAPNQPTKLRKVGGEWKLYGGPGDPQNAAAATVMKMVEVLSARRAIKDFPAPNPANFAAIAATLYVWVDGFNPPPAADPKAEPVKKGEPVKVEFGRAEGENVYVRRTLPGQAPAEFVLPATVRIGPGTETAPLMESVAKARLALLDPALPSFSETSPVKISVSGANNYVLVKDEKPDPATKEVLWRFESPPDRKGQVADGAAVRDLIGLLATSQSAFGRFVDENPGNPAADYSLSPPRLKVVVSIDNKPENDRGFEFGKDTADPDKVFARVVGRPAVFTLQRRALDRFANPDLRDRVIFRGVPAAQVNVVELTGWGGIALKFEKNKDGVWVTQPPTPPTFVVDPAKVNAFLDLLTRTPVRSFEKGAPEARHGFGDPKQNLQVVLKWPGGAISLNLGASPDGGATFYGSSAWLPQTDPVFTIDAALFKPYKDGPGGFAK